MTAVSKYIIKVNSRRGELLKLKNSAFTRTNWYKITSNKYMLEIRDNILTIEGMRFQ